MSHASIQVRPCIHRKRRGIAMLLVMLSLMTAMIITAGYVASRDNSGIIGDNVATAAASKWAAVSGLDMAIAILQTEADWRNGHTNGQLVSDYPLGSALIVIDLIDSDTNAPPTDTTDNVRITVTAAINGVSHSATATAAVPLSGASGTTITVSLPEFAVFAEDSIDMKDQATIMRWPAAPASADGKRVALGVQSIAATSVRLQDAAAAIDTTVYHKSGASDYLISNAGPIVQQQDLADTIPLPDSPAPPGGAPIGGQSDRSITGVVSLAGGSRRYNDVDVGSALTLQDTELIVEGDLTMRPNSTLFAKGEIDIVVYGDLNIGNNSVIELDEDAGAPDASITLWVQGDITIVGGSIGDFDGATPDSAGDQTWRTPDDIVIYDIDSGTTPTWRVEGQSVVLGHYYGPSAALQLRDSAAMYGRAAVHTIEMEGHASVYYDHSIDTGFGYTQATSPVFTSDSGAIRPEVTNLNSLSEADLTALADAVGLNVADGRTNVAPTGGVGVEPPPDPGATTPRIVDVDFKVDTIGSDIDLWEQSASPCDAAENSDPGIGAEV